VICVKVIRTEGSRFGTGCDCRCLMLRGIVASRACPRYVGAPGRLVIWRPLKLTFFKLFRPRTGLANLFRGARAEIADNFLGNYSACGNMSLPAPYFRVFQ
jgi:hypothetical protein